MTTVKIPAARSVFRLAVAVIVLAILASALKSAVPLFEDSNTRYILRLGSTLMFAASSLAVLWLLFSVIVKVGAFLVPALVPEPVEIKIPEQNRVVEVTDSIEGTLTAIYQGQKDLRQGQHDLQEYTRQLATQVRAMTEKADEMRKQAARIEQAIMALPGRKENPLWARHVAKLPDESLRILFNSNSDEDIYWERAAKIAAGHMGTLEQWGDQYYRFSLGLMDRAQYLIARMVDMAAAERFADAAPCLQQAQTRLQAVNKYLAADGSQWHEITPSNQPQLTTRSM